MGVGHTVKAAAAAAAAAGLVGLGYCWTRGQASRGGGGQARATAGRSGRLVAMTAAAAGSAGLGQLLDAV